MNKSERKRQVAEYIKENDNGGFGVSAQDVILKMRKIWTQVQKIPRC